MDYNNFSLIATEPISEKLPKNFENAQFYKLKSNDVTIGFALINNGNTNNIFISILEDYRGNGYGKILFDLVLNLLKNDFDEIILDIENSNYRMINILNKKKALELSHINGVKRFLIKL